MTGRSGSAKFGPRRAHRWRDASEVRGGTRQDLHEGDVLAIPSGVPHQFTDVSDPFLYFVVKVEA